MEIEMQIDTDKAIEASYASPEKALEYLKELRHEIAKELKDIYNFNEYCKCKDMPYDMAARFYSYLHRYTQWLPGDKYKVTQWDEAFDNFVSKGINTFYPED